MGDEGDFRETIFGLSQLSRFQQASLPILLLLTTHLLCWPQAALVQFFLIS
jgi:hypothetical protein